MILKAINPTIPWVVSGIDTPNNLKIRFCEILLRHSLIPTSILDLSLDALEKVFTKIAPEGFTFGFKDGQWKFYRQNVIKLGVTNKLDLEQKGIFVK